MIKRQFSLFFQFYFFSLSFALLLAFVLVHTSWRWPPLQTLCNCYFTIFIYYQESSSLQFCYKKDRKVRANLWGRGGSLTDWKPCSKLWTEHQSVRVERLYTQSTWGIRGQRVSIFFLSPRLSCALNKTTLSNWDMSHLSQISYCILSIRPPIRPPSTCQLCSLIRPNWLTSLCATLSIQRTLSSLSHQLPLNRIHTCRALRIMLQRLINLILSLLLCRAIRAAWCPSCDKPRQRTHWSVVLYLSQV